MPKNRGIGSVGDICDGRTKLKNWKLLQFESNIYFSILCSTGGCLSIDRMSPEE